MRLQAFSKKVQFDLCCLLCVPASAEAFHYPIFHLLQVFDAKLQSYVCFKLNILQGAMLICGGVIFHLCLNSMFFVPLNLIETHPLNIWQKHDRKKKQPDTKQNAVSSVACEVSTLEICTKLSIKGK